MEEQDIGIVADCLRELTEGAIHGLVNGHKRIRFICASHFGKRVLLAQVPERVTRSMGFREQRNKKIPSLAP